MADEGMKLRISAVAKLEKYAPGVSSEDIHSGKAKPIEVITSEDVLTDPDETKLKMLQDMGYNITKDMLDQARQIRTKEEN
jgi:hypothetical protein